MKNKVYIDKKEATKISQIYYYISQRQQFNVDNATSNAYHEAITGANIKMEVNFGIPDLEEIIDVYNSNKNTLDSDFGSSHNLLHDKSRNVSGLRLLSSK